MSFTLNLDVAVTTEKVFSFIADFTTTPQWYSAVQRVVHLQGAGGVGSRYAVYRQLPTGAVVNTVEVTSYTEGHEIAFTSVGGPTPFSYHYLIKSAPQGTRLQLEGTISADGLPGAARLLGPMAERLFKHGMRDNLDVLKEVLEGKRPTTA